ncbi:MAG: DUF72 domain-containing protein [Myxococcales bacterium]|nr:DUF72 domain-containing protein [Myxococcales bacterium]
MRLHVGTDSLRGDIAAYARRFDLLELLAEKGRLPKKARLAEMKRAVHEQFSFTVRLPASVSTLEWNAEAEAGLAYALDVSGVLGAEILVLQTPPSVMPSARNRRRLVELRQRLPVGRALAWEPRGLWDDEVAEAAAHEIGAALVRDVSREPAPEGDTLYTRLRALGRSGVSLDALARTAEAALGAQLACVVIEGDGAATAATRLRKMVIEAAEAASFEDDDEGEAEDDDELEGEDELEGDDEDEDELEDDDEDEDDEE